MAATPAEPPRTNWYSLPPETVAERLNTSIERGLDSAEARKRLQEHGPNRLAERKAEPKWRAFLRQYRELMQIILVGAAIVSFAATQEVGTTLVLLGLTVLNAFLGLSAESKAAASLAAASAALLR